MNLPERKNYNICLDEKIELIDFVETAPGVLETAQDPVVISNDAIKRLVEVSRSTPRGRARLLLHGDRTDSLHEMVIVLPSESCDHPHINFKSGKSFLAFAGQFAVLCFSDDGSKMQAHVLSGDDRWPGARILRLRKPVWHTVIPLEGDTVFLESIIGPFEGNKFASWFPEEESAARSAWVERCQKFARTARLGTPGAA
jgi:cupin fold WbuC family metalloprotein